MPGFWERAMGRGRRAAGAWVLAAVVALTGAGCAAIDVPAEPDQVPETPTPAQTATPTAAPTEAPTGAPAGRAAPTPEPTPYDGELVLMRIPSLGVEAPIEAIGKIPGANKLDVPQPRNVGWYDIYDKPGFGTSSLFSAHKDWHPDIRGPFYALTELEDGDLVIVVMDDGREYVYEVFFQRRYVTGEMPMADLIWPHEAEDEELLRPADEEWVTLITCGGDFIPTEDDGSGYYVHRDVVIARLVETRLGDVVQSIAGGD
ncbi:MAG: sortase [Dehalococcoidia bacterium]|nr:sortase [Dehalococcoidia bacterium]MYD27850.1 sortase [Dehalococcoidia bacterium]